MTMSKPVRFSLPVVALATMAMPSALAEGGWDSHISGALPGFTSRNWHDGWNRGTATKITFTGCNFRPHDTVLRNVTVQLTRDDHWTPDENMGRKKLACASSDTGNWGVMKSADYHFTVTQGFIHDGLPAESVQL